MKLLLAPFLIAAACILAGLYGMVHNQISYSVSPGYFHEFKFIQFGIQPELQSRLGAAIVGWQASWWMGIVIGLPICLLSLAMRGTGAFVRTFLLAALMVVAIALLTGLGALAAGYLAIQEGHLPGWMAGWEVSDPTAFARAGLMHDFSYMGGLFGLLAGGVMVIGKIRASRQRSRRP
ncbi:hypothetical protein [Paracoccus alkanivorans]|uniref:Signal peptide-containing protein n=1 Tax=Paracoccus alkanivorans TaxID=2116655 RepID=A0A3M0MN16_9RHOB|nr:hypothetical protein [Paracoccus alkanivorans]RMC37724.1 hypothetical protein C9E81_03005 [Paracoccus alkanivorans]